MSGDPQRRALGFASLAIGLALAVAGCQAPNTAESSLGASPSPAEPTHLTIFAAASLADALADVEAAYEAAVPGVDLQIAADSSAALRTQIEQGAPADVFLSADTANPQRLVDGGLALGTSTPFAGNSLALIVPGDNPSHIASPADVAEAGVQIVAAGPEVPITGYVSQLLINLSTESGYPADFAQRYRANVVSEEDNVSGIVAKIEQGVGDAGFVYRTDALGSDVAGVVAIPPDANVHAAYAGVVVLASSAPLAAHAFLDWMAGPDGQAILADHGFVAP